MGMLRKSSWPSAWGFSPELCSSFLPRLPPTCHLHGRPESPRVELHGQHRPQMCAQKEPRLWAGAWGPVGLPTLSFTPRPHLTADRLSPAGEGPTEKDSVGGCSGSGVRSQPEAWKDDRSPVGLLCLLLPPSFPSFLSPSIFPTSLLSFLAFMSAISGSGTVLTSRRNRPLCLFPGHLHSGAGDRCSMNKQRPPPQAQREGRMRQRTMCPACPHRACTSLLTAMKLTPDKPESRNHVFLPSFIFLGTQLVLNTHFQ